jgi:hypothetical protein
MFAVAVTGDVVVAVCGMVVVVVWGTAEVVRALARWMGQRRKPVGGKSGG